MIQTSLPQLSVLKQALLGDKNGGRGWLQFRGFAWNRRLVVDRQLCQYFRLKIEELTFNGVCRLAGFILGQVATLGDKLRNLAADLNHLAEEFGSPRALGALGSPGDRPEMTRVVADTIGPHKAELLAEMEHVLEQDLHRAAANGGDGCSERARSFAASHGAIADSSPVQESHHAGDHRGLERRTARGDFLAPCRLEGGHPAPARLWRRRRLLLVTPDDLSPVELLKQISNEVLQPPTAVADKENEVLLCYEMEQLPLRRVAAAVLDHRFQNVEVASRLHTRIDVSWPAL